MKDGSSGFARLWLKINESELIHILILNVVFSKRNALLL